MWPFRLRCNGPASPKLASTRRRWETLVLAVLPVFSHWRARAEYEPLIPLAIEVVGTILVASLLLMLTEPRLRYGLTVALLSTPILSVFPSAFHAGQPIAVEVLMLSLFGTLSIALAVTHPIPRLLSLAVICGGFLVIFVSLSSDQKDAMIIPVIWLLVCMWHLIANHWERLDVCLARNIRRSPWIQPLSILLASTLVLFALGLTLNRIQTTRATAGIMPTSGGSRWDAPNARAGVGTGELAIAAEENADSFGAVDSDVLLESHESSLFDMFNETAGEPIKTRKNDPAQALQGPTEIQPHIHASKTDKGGQSFATARQAPKFLERKQENIRNEDILQWIGTTGIRLGMKRFNSFDGFDWTVSGGQATNVLPQIQIGQQQWSIDPRLNRPIDLEHHLGSLRVIRLNSARMATPMLTMAVNIKDVQRSDFYGIEADGSWYMPGREKIPSLSVLHFLSESVLEDELWEPDAFKQDQSALYSHSSLATRGIQKALSLAAQWTEDHHHSYEKITSIITRLRSYATYDPTIGSDSEDPLLAFLQQRRGGAYLFATTAATMLRSQGFHVRLATGFYVSPHRYDPSAGHTSILQEDLHVWVEVQLSDGRWIEFEPTPGFMPPHYKPSWFHQTKQWARTVAPYAAVSTIFAWLCFRLRPLWMNWLVSSIWFLTRIKSERAQLFWTIRILEIRAILAKSPRSSGINQRDWLIHLASNDDSLALCVQRYCDVAEQVVFGEKPLHHEWHSAARLMLRQMNVKFFRTHGIQPTYSDAWKP